MDIKIENGVPGGAPVDPDMFVKLADRAETNQQALSQIQEDRASGLKPAATVIPERCNEIEFKFQDLKIKMSRPRFALDMRAKRIMQHEKFADLQLMAYACEEAKSMLYIEALNDVPVDRPSNMVEYEALLQSLKPEGVQAVQQMHQKYFPPVTEAEIQVIKKS